MDNDPVVIVGLSRTPQGNMLGQLSPLSAVDLGAHVIQSAIKRAHLTNQDINEVMMGCVLPAGVGQAPARQAALKAGLNKSTTCTTINKVCGSGMKAVMLACNILQSSDPTAIIVAGGMESMSNAPHLLPKAREGYRLGNATLIDHMTYDGLEDAYDKGRPMGYFAEQCAKEYSISRSAQDSYAETSLARARQATHDQLFAYEIEPILAKTTIAADEHPFSVDTKRIPSLKPIFIENGTITAANASSIADGAAALVLMRESEAKKRQIKPLAKIIGFKSHANEPAYFATAPIDAIKKLLTAINWPIEQVDLFEINEAFAAVALIIMNELNIPHEKLNIYGGGCALGHPIGATGARLIVTLIAALKQKKLKYGIASLCIGGGEATAIALECYE